MATPAGGNLRFPQMESGAPYEYKISLELKKSIVCLLARLEIAEARSDKAEVAQW